MKKKISDLSKRRIVTEVLSGRMTKEEARRTFGIKSKSGILEWMREFAGRPGKEAGFNPVPKLYQMKDSLQENQRLKARIQQLEQELSLSQMKGDAYRIMVEIAKENYGIDLKKKSGAKQSKGSKK